MSNYYGLQNLNYYTGLTGSLSIPAEQVGISLLYIPYSDKNVFKCANGDFKHKTDGITEILERITTPIEYGLTSGLDFSNLLINDLSGPRGTALVNCYGLYGISDFTNLEKTLVSDSIKGIAKMDIDKYLIPGILPILKPDCKISLNVLYSGINFLYTKLKDNLQFLKLFKTVIFIIVFLPFFIAFLSLYKFNIFLPLVIIPFIFLSFNSNYRINLKELENNIRKISQC